MENLQETDVEGRRVSVTKALHKMLETLIRYKAASFSHLSAQVNEGIGNVQKALGEGAGNLHPFSLQPIEVPKTETCSTKSDTTSSLGNAVEKLERMYRQTTHDI